MPRKPLSKISTSKPHPKPSTTSKAQRRKNPLKARSKATLQMFEVEVLAGLLPSVRRELKPLKPRLLKSVRHEEQPLLYSGDTMALKRLRTAVAVYAVTRFEVPRPKALLGHEHFTALCTFLEQVMAQDTFQSFRIDAAGKHSAVFKRLRTDLAAALALPYDDTEGELLLRVRPNLLGDGWEVLARLTPKPLSARAWRQCNLAGGLNASLAAAMIKKVGFDGANRIFNPMCGSGTLMIEARQLGFKGEIVGCDISPEAVHCSQTNITAAQANHVNAFVGDACKLAYPQGHMNIIVSDLPWGDAVGSNHENTALYPAFLQEMTRISSKNARMVLLTHEIRLFDSLIGAYPWEIDECVRVYHGGHHPGMYVLRRSGT